MANKDFEELFASLNSRNVKAIIVGAYAVAFHAKPRYTKDIDVFVEPTTDNVERLLAALTDFGFEGLDLEVSDFVPARGGVQLGVEPNRVDLITVIDGVTFADAWQGRVPGKYGSQPVNYLGLAELIRNKRASGRPQDLADIDILER
jgi:hypothetical protein